MLGCGTSSERAACRRGPGRRAPCQAPPLRSPHRPPAAPPPRTRRRPPTLRPPLLRRCSSLHPVYSEVAPVASAPVPRAAGLLCRAQPPPRIASPWSSRREQASCRAQAACPHHPPSCPDAESRGGAASPPRSRWKASPAPSPPPSP
eukprot:scaffold73455_cov67-Phaeocystis_antarctica.AAC.4